MMALCLTVPKLRYHVRSLKRLIYHIKVRFSKQKMLLLAMGTMHLQWCQSEHAWSLVYAIGVTDTWHMFLNVHVQPPATCYAETPAEPV